MKAMSELSGHYRHVLRLGLPIFAVWVLVWSLGITALAWVAVDLRDELRETDLDSELALYATAVYGLTWFDEQGQFHDEILRLESDIAAAPYDIWVLEPESVPDQFIQHYAPAQPRFQTVDFSALPAIVMGRAQDVYQDGVDAAGNSYRLHAIPTFMGQGETEKAKAMVVVVADPQPGVVAYQDFVQRILLVSVALGMVGLLLGVALTSWSLRPVLSSLRQRERFISATAHELRTPLAALRSMNDSARQGDEVPEKALQQMSGVLQQASDTVDDLLLFARLDAGAGLQCELLRLDLLAEMLLPEDDSIHFVADESVVNADPRLVRVAIRNLLENARKHSHAAEQGITLSVSGATVTVTDQGNGFPVELLQRQKRDFVLSPSQGGSGLGLAIVNLIARLHGGSLTLANQQPQGAKVILTLAG